MPLHQRYRQRIKPGTLNSYSCEDTLCATPWAAKFPVKILAKIHFLVIFQTCQECIPTHDCTGNNLWALSSPPRCPEAGHQGWTATEISCQISPCSGMFWMEKRICSSTPVSNIQPWQKAILQWLKHSMSPNLHKCLLSLKSNYAYN